jgi:hypothetical protein
MVESDEICVVSLIVLVSSAQGSTFKRWRKEIFPYHFVDKRIARLNSDQFSQAIWLGCERLYQHCIDVDNDMLPTYG